MNDVVKKIAEPIHTLIGGAKTPDTPEQIAAPIPDDLKARMARERKAQRKYGMAGRAGTILTSDDSKLG